MESLRCTSYLYLSLAQHSQLPTRCIDCKYRRVKLQFVCSQIKTATTSNTTLKSESASAFSRCRKSTNSNAQCSLTGSNSQTGVRDAAFETAQHHSNSTQSWIAVIEVTEFKVLTMTIWMMNRAMLWLKAEL